MLQRCLLAMAMVLSLGAAEKEVYFSWGDHLEGPLVTPVDFEGRVVLLAMWDEDMWNVEWIRQLGPLRKKYGDKLLIIASHWYDGDKQRILDAWSMVDGGELICLMKDSRISTDRRLSSFVDDEDRVRTPLGSRGGISHAGYSSYDRACFLIDHTGTLIAQDNVESIAKQLPAVYKAACGHLAYGREWEQFAKEAADLGEARRNMSRSLAELRKAFEEADMVKIDEAQALLDRVAAWATREMAEIQRCRTADATSCLMRLERMVAWLKGDELGEPFVELLKELKKDKIFLSTLKAEAMVRSMRADAFSMGLAKDPRACRTNKSYLKRIVRIGNTLNGIVDSLPEAAIASKANEMLAAYGF